MTSAPFAPLPPPIPDAAPDVWDLVAKQFEPQDESINRADTWAASTLGEHLWSKQREITLSVRDERYTAVQSCHDAGKSFVAARIAAWWLARWPQGEAFVVSTAPTAAQVSAILWREILKAHTKGDLPGSISMSGYPKWSLPNGELVGYGRKPADYSESAFQGIHARYVLIIMDEACGVTQSLYDAVDSLATNKNARVLAIGNPDDPTSHFATVCKPDSGWNVIRIDGLQTPNVTQQALDDLDCRQCRKVGSDTTLLATLMEEEGITPTTEDIPEVVRDMLLSPLWIEERLHRWVGRPSTTEPLRQRAAESSLFTSKVRGLFPTSSNEGVIPLGWVERAFDRHDDWLERNSPIPESTPGTPFPLFLGVDVAGQGLDETAIALRYNTVVTEIRKYRQADTMETTGYVTGLLDGSHGSLAVVDSIGIGAGVVDRLREMDKQVLAFNAAGSATHLRDRSNEFGFLNLRAAAWWNLRELLDPSRDAKLALPRNEMLAADLTSPRWKVVSGGKIQIESKDDIRKRLGRSTDAGDAVVHVAWYDRRFDAGDAGGTDTLDWWDGADSDVLDWGVEGLAQSW